MVYIGFILIFLQSFYFIEQIYGHGYLADPPARSSAWLTDPDFAECCKYYNHIEMSCGGTYRQWTVNGGKCSICGEPDDRKPQLFGMGGAMYKGKIVRTYTQGSFIPVTVVITANHLGVFEFRVCSLDNDPTQDATQSCLDLNVLKVANGQDQGQDQYQIQRSFTTVHVNVTLPPDLVCKHCVFQWKYRTGNSWGSANGKACLGCGRENEEFYGCSDIAVVSSIESTDNLLLSVLSPLPSTSSSSIIPTTANEVTIKSTTTVPPRKCKSVIIFSQSFDLSNIMDQYCRKICPNNCPLDKIDGNEILYNGCVNSCKQLCECH